MYNLREVLHQFPYGAPIQNVTGQSFFQDFDIRKVLPFDWKKLIKRGLVPEEYDYFTSENIPFYVFPLCLHSSYTFDDLIALDDALQPIPGRGKPLDFPPNIQAIHNTHAVVVCGGWEDFIEAHKKKIERLFPLGSAIVLIDGSINTFEKNKVDLWLDSLKSKDVYAYKGKYHIQVKEKLIRLGVEHRDTLTEVKKEHPKVNRPKAEVVYLNKAELVEELKSKGIPATIDTVRKITKLVDIPFTKKSALGYDLYHPGFFVLFYKNREKGLERVEAAKKAIKDFKG